jgi:hypothetical protein
MKSPLFSAIKPEKLLLLAQGRFRPLALADVSHDRPHRLRLTIAIAQQVGFEFDGERPFRPCGCIPFRTAATRHAERAAARHDPRLGRVPFPRRQVHVGHVFQFGGGRTPAFPDRGCSTRAGGPAYRPGRTHPSCFRGCGDTCIRVRRIDPACRLPVPAPGPFTDSMFPSVLVPIRASRTSRPPAADRPTRRIHPAIRRAANVTHLRNAMQRHSIYM